MHGLTFLNLSFLPWLLALGIPIVIHLLTRRTRRNYVLPTYRFVQKSLARQSQVYRVRRPLLLAARLLLLLFLVLTFLKPVLPAPLASNAEDKQALVVVLDTSLSMGYTHNGASSLARVRNQVSSLLDDLRSGDRANVILIDSAPHPVLPKPGGDFGTLQSVIKTAQPTEMRGEIAAAVAMATEQLAADPARQKTLVLASDFQQTNWADVKFDALPPNVKLVYLNSDTEERDNAAITSLKLRPSTPHAGEEASVVAEVWNSSRAARSLNVTLTIQRDDVAESSAAQPAPQTVVVPPYATGTVSFPITFADAGRYRITARLPKDSLPADDARYLVADLRHSLTVLLLTDAPLSGNSGAYFLSRALNPVPDQPGGVRVLPRHPTDLTENDLKSCDAVLLDEVTTLPADRLPLISRYVSDGGALIAFLSGINSVGQMQALAKMAKPGEGLPFLPTTAFDAHGHGKGYVILTEARYDSPLLHLFKDPAVADLGKIHFTRFFQTTPPDGRAEVLLRFEDGTPAAARREMGAGSVLICNFSPNLSDSDLARQEVFPPLVHEFLKGMTGKEGEHREFYPGGVASAALETDQAKAKVVAFGPDGAPETATVDRTSGGVILDHATGIGFHTILANGRPAAAIAVNPHPDESDLRALDPRELESRRTQHASYTVHAGQNGALAEIDQLQHSRPLWPYCLLAAFLFLILEHLLATFGSQVRVRPDAVREA